METATAYLKLKDQFNLTLDQIGKRVGNTSNSAVSNKLRLLKLATPIQEMLVKGEMTEGQARPLIGLDDDFAIRIAKRIIKEGWSTHKVEQFIVNLKKDKQENSKVSAKTQPYQKQQTRIQKKLGADVSIQTNTRGAGKITIRFKNENEFDRLQKLLS
jgi:ParB family transcriptional regulator, chromosome partitioning protein